MTGKHSSSALYDSEILKGERKHRHSLQLAMVTALPVDLISRVNRMRQVVYRCAKKTQITKYTSQNLSCADKVNKNIFVFKNHLTRLIIMSTARSLIVVFLAE